MTVCKEECQRNEWKEELSGVIPGKEIERGMNGEKSVDVGEKEESEMGEVGEEKRREKWGGGGGKEEREVGRWGRKRGEKSGEVGEEKRREKWGGGGGKEEGEVGRN
ncbi:hypothetical protein Pmani_039262 [Petrolisthes manimaculis]|uniref:Uncharacterized protein n=1 Tax=Petrolisthes manimaculis TaxID=1843537 RepID=A0AAE1NCW4_9EUCA|nr:hypothetical protein Pmani_039262 [Petrolisthes manimaculis]